MTANLRPTIEERRRLLALILGAAAFYVTLLPRPYVGYFNDDSLYVMAAQSLLQGKYVHLQLPTQPPLTDPLPGYPLFLAPFVKLFAPHWSALKWTSLAATLLSVWLLFELFEGWLEPRWRLMFCLSVAFNPTIADFSRAVMSEPFFLLMLALTFLCLKKHLQRETAEGGWILGAFAGAVALVRPQGAMLAPSIALLFIYRQEWATLRRMVPGFLFVWLPIYLRNAYLSNELSGYSTSWTSSFLLLSGHPVEWLRRGGIVLQTILTKNVFDLSIVPSSVSRHGGAPLVFVFLSGLTLAGCRAVMRSTSEEQQALGFSIIVFALAYAWVHSLWIALDPRYFIPIVPFVLVFLFRGAAVLMDSRFKLPLIGAGLLLLGNSIYADAHLLVQTYAAVDPLRRSLPGRTLDWIRASTKAHAKIMTNKNLLIFLYTDRYTFTIDSEDDPEALRYWLLSEGIEFIVLMPEPMLNARKASQWINANAWVASDRVAYQPAFSDALENARIYRVTPDDIFRDAYGMALLAEADSRTGNWTDALKKCERAHLLRPNLAKPLSLKGVILLATHKDLKSARNSLSRAVHLNPNLMLAHLNLARVEIQQGHFRAAAASYENAIDCAQRSYDQPALDAIQAEFNAFEIHQQ